MRIKGLRPPAASPAATEQACPSRLTPTRRSDGSACIKRNSQLVSLSGSQTTSVTPFAFICASTVSGLRATVDASLIFLSAGGRAIVLPRQSDRQPARDDACGVATSNEGAPLPIYQLRNRRCRPLKCGHGGPHSA